MVAVFHRARFAHESLVAQLDARIVRGEGSSRRRIALLKRKLRHICYCRRSGDLLAQPPRKPPPEEPAQWVLDGMRRKYLIRIADNLHPVGVRPLARAPDQRANRARQAKVDRLGLSDRLVCRLGHVPARLHVLQRALVIGQRDRDDARPGRYNPAVRNAGDRLSTHQQPHFVVYVQVARPKSVRQRPVLGAQHAVRRNRKASAGSHKSAHRRPSPNSHTHDTDRAGGARWRPTSNPLRRAGAPRPPFAGQRPAR